MTRQLTIYKVLQLSAVFFLCLSSTAVAQETVCVECHGAQPGRLGAPVELWRGSIHADNGTSCHSCHGGDPADYAMAMSPERGFVGVPAPQEIPEFCGKCHVGVLKDYSDSAHGRALGKGGPQCATCHNAHDIQKATPELINRESCTRCHDYGRAEQIKSAVVGTDRQIADLEEDLARLHRTGIATEEMEEALFSLRNRFHRLFHSVDVERVREATSEIRGDLDELGEQIESIDEQLFDRKVAGGVVVALLGLAGALALLIRRTYEEQE